LLDTHRIYRDAYASAGMPTTSHAEALREFGDEV
jgi:hypothetical protein